MTWQVATLATKTVTHKIFGIYSMVTHLMPRHTKPCNVCIAISLGLHDFVRCLRQFLWECYQAYSLTINLIEGGAWGRGYYDTHLYCWLLIYKEEVWLIYTGVKASLMLLSILLY